MSVKYIGTIVGHLINAYVDYNDPVLAKINLKKVIDADNTFVTALSVFNIESRLLEAEKSYAFEHICEMNDEIKQSCELLYKYL